MSWYLLHARKPGGGLRCPNRWRFQIQPASDLKSQRFHQRVPNGSFREGGIVNTPQCNLQVCTPLPRCKTAHAFALPPVVLSEGPICICANGPWTMSVPTADVEKPPSAKPPFETAPDFKFWHAGGPPQFLQQRSENAWAN